MGISQRRIEYSHKTLETSTPNDKRGKHIKYKVPDSEIEIINEYITSFPCVPSHCRKSSKKEYMEPNLLVKKFICLYVDTCQQKGIVSQKEYIYRQVFLNKFNLNFHIPKKDRCATCKDHASYIKNGFDDPNRKKNLNLFLYNRQRRNIIRQR